MANELNEPLKMQFYSLRPPSSSYATEHLQRLYSIMYTFSVLFMFPSRNHLSALRYHVKSCKVRAPGSLSLCNNNKINLPAEIGI